MSRFGTHRLIQWVDVGGARRSCRLASSENRRHGLRCFCIMGITAINITTGAACSFRVSSSSGLAFIA